MDALTNGICLWILIVVGLRFMPYESHNVSDPLLNIKYWHLGYLHNQILLTNWLIWSDEYLPKISSSIILSFPITFLVINRMINGSSTTSNQLEAGSIMVRAMKSIDEPSLPLSLSVYGPTRLTHKASHGVLITILDGSCPYCHVHFLFTWWQASLAWLGYGSDSVSHSFSVYCSFHCLLKTGMPGVLEIVVIPHRCMPFHGFSIISLPILHMQLLFSTSWSSSPLSRTALCLKNYLSVVSAFWASTISFTVKGCISSSSLRFANT